MSNYIPEEQEGQVYTSEQETPSQQLQANEKTFDPNHPQVAQPKNPTPGATQQPRQFPQGQQMDTSEQSDRTAAQAAAYGAATDPVITSFSPTTASVGATITIKGSGLTGTTAVTFTSNKAGTSVTVVDDNTVTAVIPASAVTGTISVTAPSGTSETNVAPKTVTSAGSLTIV